MLAAPASRKMVITRSRRLAMMRGPAAMRPGVVLVDADVTDPVQAIVDPPVTADDRGQFRRAGPGKAQRGDRVAGRGGPFLSSRLAAG